MSGHRIEYIPRAAPVRQRRPRVKDSGHLENVRRLPCVVCGGRPAEAAHIRSGSEKYGKRWTGIAEKSSDRWTVPLCAFHHRFAPDAQHRGNELDFWNFWQIDPFATALALWAADGDLTAMEQISRMARTYR